MGNSADAMIFYGYHLPVGYDPIDREKLDAAPLYGKDRPVLLGEYGSCDEPTYYVYVQASETKASWEEPKKIESNSMTWSMNHPRGEWNKWILDFAEEYELVEPGREADAWGARASRIGWWLAAYWG